MQRKPAWQPSPSKPLCPNCRTPKNLEQTICPNCGVRSCPNGHILDSKLCRQCGWVDKNFKPAAANYSGDILSGGSTAMAGGQRLDRCPVCDSRIDPKTGLCTSCGNLARPDWEHSEEAKGYIPGGKSPVPVGTEQYTVNQEEIGHHDKKRTYQCPKCGERVSADAVKSGKCTFCGYVGTMQYEVKQHTPSSRPSVEIRSSRPLQQQMPPQPQSGYGMPAPGGNVPKPQIYPQQQSPVRPQYPQPQAMPFNPNQQQGYPSQQPPGYPAKQPQWQQDYPQQPPSYPMQSRQGFPQQPPQTGQQGYPQQPPAQMRQQQGFPPPPPPVPRQAKKQPNFASPIQCPNCGAENSPDTKFCQQCGYRSGTGRVSRQTRLMSTAEWSAAAASQESELFRPIYPSQDYEGEADSMPSRRGKGKAQPKDKQKAREYRQPGERTFPMGLLMAVIVVTAMIIGLGIYVISMMLGTGSQSSGTVATPPQITDISASFTSDTAAEVKWITDEPATSQVMVCDPAGVCSWSDPDKALVKEHRVLIDKLKKGVDYHLTVKSADADGTETVVEKDHIFGTTTVTNPSDTTAPVISGVNFNNLSDISITVVWTTNEAATSKIEYGTTQSYGSATAEDAVPKTSHSVMVSGLTPDTIYYFKIVNKDQNGNTATWDQVTANLNPFKTAAAVPIGPKIGQRAPDFTLPDMNGVNVKLSDYRGKIVMINFWFKDCAPCVAEMPHIQDVYKTWTGSKPLVVLAINPLDAPAAIQQFMTSPPGYTFPALRDSNSGVSTIYPTPPPNSTSNSYPRTFFINTDGIIKDIKHGSAFSGKTEIETILKTL